MPETDDTEVVTTEIPNTDSTETITNVKPADAPDFDRPSLEAKVEAGLTSLIDEDETEPDEVEETTETETERQEDAPNTSETEAAATDDASETTQSQTDTPTLPSKYVRTLKAMEWTDEEIADAAKRPELLPTIEKLHQSRMKQTQQFAELGRRQREVEAVKQPVSPANPGKLEKIDTESLRKIYGNEPFIEQMERQNAWITKLESIVPMVEAMQQQVQSSNLEAIGTQIETFFGGAELKPFEQVYGKLSKDAKPSEEQIQNRNKVLKMADQLMVGAKAQGYQMSLNEAMQTAHDAVASDFKVKTARTTLVKEIKKRNRGITLVPTSRKSAAQGKVNSRDELLRKAKAGLNSVFATA